MTVSVQCAMCNEWSTIGNKNDVHCPKCSAEYGLDLDLLMRLKMEAVMLYSKLFHRYNMIFCVTCALLSFFAGWYGTNAFLAALTVWFALWIPLMFKFSSLADRKVRSQPQFADFYGNPCVRE